MIRLILMRHGNTFEAGEVPIQVGARTDLPLTAFGRKQAEAMARYLAAEGISPRAVYAGGLKRQKDSAAILSEKLGARLMLEPALTEIDYGDWEGLTGEEIGKKWPKEHLAWIEGKWPEGIFVGSEAEYRKGIEKWLESLKKGSDGCVVAVTSNGVLRLFQNEKVKTGHFCELHLLDHGYKIIKWNRLPVYPNEF